MQGPPRYVALCGAPGSGKSTVAAILCERYGARLVDDGEGLRLAAQALWGLSHDDTHTQSGKARSRIVCGQEFTHRQLLGDLGSLLTGHFGLDVIPEAAIAKADSDPVRTPFHVFASVRGQQGALYRQHGAIVVEVSRPGYVPVNAFDRWDDANVTHRLANDGAEDDLVDAVARLLDPVFGELIYQPAGGHL